jgi:hypothetical protein
MLSNIHPHINLFNQILYLRGIFRQISLVVDDAVLNIQFSIENILNGLMCLFTII